MKNIFILEDQKKCLELISDVARCVFSEVGNDTNVQPKKTIEIQHKDRLATVTDSDFAMCDIAFIDLSLPDGLSFDIIIKIKDTYPDIPVIVTTLYADDDMVFQALKSGADGYLLKSDGKKGLKKCLRRILEGEPPISPQIARKLMAQFNPQSTMITPRLSEQSSPTREKLISKDTLPEESLKLSELSGREHQVLTLIAQGLTTKEIASKLNLSVHTINDIIKSIYKKLNVHSRAKATNLALRSGLI